MTLLAVLSGLSTKILKGLNATLTDDTPTDGLSLLLDDIGHCPPEDVGGRTGYTDYLEAISPPIRIENMRL